MTRLKFGVFGHPKRPKVPIEKVVTRIRSLGVTYSQDDPDVAIVVGGDGTFGYYGRTLPIPLLFVGVREPGFVGSKAKLAEIFYEDFDRAVGEIDAGRYCVEEAEMLSTKVKGRSVDVLTDIYLERGTFSGCLRYSITVRRSGKSTAIFGDYAVGNGVIVCTAFGAGGYFSYPDRIRSPVVQRRTPLFPRGRIGICHIIPTFLVRKAAGKVSKSVELRYTVPNDSMIQMKLHRDVDARLYGTTMHSKGIAVNPDEAVIVRRSNRSAKLIRLRSGKL